MEDSTPQKRQPMWWKFAWYLWKNPEISFWIFVSAYMSYINVIFMYLLLTGDLITTQEADALKGHYRLSGAIFLLLSSWSGFRIGYKLIWNNPKNNGLTPQDKIIAYFVLYGVTLVVLLILIVFVTE